MKAILARHGYIFDENKGIWHRQDFDGIAYTDGDEVENRLFDIISNAKDLSVLSDELKPHCTDWPSLYHLSSTRANILRPFDEDLSGDILEIGAGCGAITRYLGECGGNVLALEGTPRRAMIARSRTRDLENVTVLNEKFENFNIEKQFDVITLIGVLEYANLFTSSETPAMTMLEMVRKLLKPDGKLIIAIENQLGLKYFAGAPEDHIGKAMYGIEGRYTKNQPQTYGRKILNDMLSSTGFESVDFLAPFPDYKLPVSIVTEEGFNDENFDASTFAWQSVNKDPQLPQTLSFNQEMAWIQIAENKLGIDLSNSFLIRATNNKSKSKILPLAWHYSSNRKQQYCKSTFFYKRHDGVIDTNIKTMSSKSDENIESHLLEFNITEKEDYFSGNLLAIEIVKILTIKDWSLDELANTYLRYLKVVLKLAKVENSNYMDSNLSLPGIFIDCVPSNIICSKNGNHIFFDKEWRWHQNIKLGYLLFRSIIQHNPDYVTATIELSNNSIQGLLEALFKKFGWEISDDQISEYLQIECEFASQVNVEEVSFEKLKTAIQKQFNFVRYFESKSKYDDIQILFLNNKINELETSTLDFKAKIDDYEYGLRERVKQINDLSRLLIERNDRIKTHEDRIDNLNYELKNQYNIIYLARKICLTLIGKIRNKYFFSKVRLTGLFDESFYLSKYPDIKISGINPLSHYMEFGWREMRDPSSIFSTKLYLDNNPDVRESGTNPLVHYLFYGKKEGRLLPVIHKSNVDEYNDGFLVIKKILIAIFKKHLYQKFFYLAKTHGLKYALHIASEKIKNLSKNQSLLNKTSQNLFNVVPLYLDPSFRGEINRDKKVAVHLHLFYKDMCPVFLKYLNNIPLNFDLFISASAQIDIESSRNYFINNLQNLNSLVIENVPNKGRDIAPMIINFGTRLQNYDYIGHFHSKKSQHNSTLQNWFKLLMDSLCGSKQNVLQIFKLLEEGAKVIYPRADIVSSWDPSGWALNKKNAYSILKKYSNLKAPDFSYVDFPKGMMFWARASCLKEYLSLSIKYNDFKEEPISVDGEIPHALERLILIFANQHQGINYEIQNENLICRPTEYYESKHDFSGILKHKNVKVLAYYLPQFHPIPENDEWHGKGFTEWTKVRSSNPLFLGHYQQHVPHPDIGYYQLSDKNQFIKQVNMMKNSGVHGMIFYHYWFSGKLILEKPVKLLLDNSDIDMPFCFCWANENWTRRWDGNEQEVLLEQIYSEKDAGEFIDYLIPFFKDDRYIKVNKRPVLYIYRPASIEGIEKYIEIWKRRCESHGISAPYLVATLTRGAKDPRDYKMDAAVERVLHDWTDGKVENISNQLNKYRDMNGSVLDYSALADHYINKEFKNDFICYRSLVPVWDNTARYGSDAYILHNFTPQKMQSWLERLIEYSKNNLPDDNRFIVVNAWNEWAEGAHLEPDAAFGYAYLNVIGRALSGIDYDEINYVEIPTNLNVKIKFSQKVLDRLRTESVTYQKFVACLKKTIKLIDCNFFIDSNITFDDFLAEEFQFSEDMVCNFDLVFDDIYLFTYESIKSLLRFGIRHHGYSVSAYVINNPDNLLDRSLKNGVITFDQRSQVELIPNGNESGYKVCVDAKVFYLGLNALGGDSRHKVSTIIRYHRSGKFEYLQSAILSLLAQKNCDVSIHLALQDIEGDELIELESKLEMLPWIDGCKKILHNYMSTNDCPDMRSEMLNVTLKKVEKGFAAFLDYDDILYTNAYEVLASRLEETQMKATFGRVFVAKISPLGAVYSRSKVYEYGFEYEDFINNNHAPLHSFMLNLNKIDLDKVNFYSDMKYMEDYYLTLQIFDKNNTDWKSLQRGIYIGDYCHREHGDSHTLAFNNNIDRNNTLASYNYLKCERRLNNLRNSLNV
jgi:lipopolysaccharide biosynthesis protein/SAM-dependent methyltransferase